MARHVVIAGPFEHDGQAYMDGDEVDLPAAVAEILLESGIVKAKPATKKQATAAEKD
jgi:hypothetical protein